MSPAEFFFDIVNVALALALIAVLQYRYRLQHWIVLLLLFHFSLIFLTNGVLFPPSYMPDQLLYLDLAQRVRGAEVAAARASTRFGVDLAGYFFGYFPLPVIDSVFSIAIINFILYLFLFVFLREKGMLEGLSLWVFLLYPSLLLYTSVSLRDTFILLFMTLGAWLYVRGKVLWSIVVQLPLVLLKLQNLGIFGASLAVFLIIAIFFPRAARRRVPFIVGIVFLGAVAAAMPFAMKYGLRGLNLYRHLFWLEEMNLPKFSPVNPATQIGGVSQLLLETVRSIPYMLVKPLPWEADNPLQLLQSLENLVVAALVVRVIWKATRSRATTPAMRFLLVLFVVSLAVYGLTVWNFGTAVRYKFPYVTVFLVFYPRLTALEAERRRVSAEAPLRRLEALPG